VARSGTFFTRGGLPDLFTASNTCLAKGSPPRGSKCTGLVAASTTPLKVTRVEETGLPEEAPPCTDTVPILETSLSSFAVSSLRGRPRNFHGAAESTSLKRVSWRCVCFFQGGSESNSLKRTPAGLNCSCVCFLLLVLETRMSGSGIRGSGRRVHGRSILSVKHNMFGF
jgi:hypothetical protein